MASKLDSIRRALADYSMRKFLIFAANPAHWLQLVETWRLARTQTGEFSRQLSNWQQVVVTRNSEPNLFFRRWLRKDRRNALEASQVAESIEHPELADVEVIFARDRLGWLLQLALVDKTLLWQQFDAWFAARWKSGTACRDAYTLSERLANLILMWNLDAPPSAIADELLGMMEDDAELLLTRIEYHGDNKTNNHVLNNARALVLFGAFSGIAKFLEAGAVLLKLQLPKHVFADGILREGSSHYQWIVARWVVEVACAFHAMDQARYQQLLPLLERMLDACEEMKLGPPGRTYLPLIGDISPDFPPWCYSGLTNFGYAVIGCGIEPVPNDVPHAGFWDSFFIGRVKPEVRPCWLSSDGSWARVTAGQWSILTHADRHPYDCRSTHGHHDLFSFELAYAGIPLIVDPGRKNYSAPRDSEEAGILEEWHNTIMVGRSRTGFIPRGYMPAKWLRQWRSCPEVGVDQTAIDIYLEAPREVPGVSRIRRTIQCLTPDHAQVVNEVRRTDDKPNDVLVVFYLMGEIRQEDQWLEILLDGRRFRLTWNGLGVPLIRSASRCLGYGDTVPCTRLEWSEMLADMTWKSTISLELMEPSK